VKLAVHSSNLSWPGGPEARGTTLALGLLVADVS
jgi:hypothetical protein